MGKNKVSDEELPTAADYEANFRELAAESERNKAHIKAGGDFDLEIECEDDLHGVGKTVKLKDLNEYVILSKYPRGWLVGGLSADHAEFGQVFFWSNETIKYLVEKSRILHTASNKNEK